MTTALTTVNVPVCGDVIKGSDGVLYIFHKDINIHYFEGKELGSNGIRSLSKSIFVKEGMYNIVTRIRRYGEPL